MGKYLMELIDGILLKLLKEISMNEMIVLTLINHHSFKLPKIKNLKGAKC